MPSAFVLCHIFLLILLRVSGIDGWHRYEQPIKLPNENGIFHWELQVEPQLTMSVLREHSELAIFDFVPENVRKNGCSNYFKKQIAWLERDKSQLKGCLENHTLVALPQTSPRHNSFAKWAKQAESAMSNLVQFHGRHQRLWAVNGQIPGPTIVVPHGATVRLRLKNRLLLESLAIHLHGIELRDQWFHGGVAPLQQCPLAVLSDFEFHFRAHPSGTHFYHNQFPAGHQSNGLLGALVVLPEGGIKEDRDFVAILQDWPWTATEEQEQNQLEGITRWATGAHGEFDTSAGNHWSKKVPEDGVWSILVNQKGWHEREEILHRPGNIPWSKFPVGKDEQVRFRLIHGGYRHPLVVHIENHPMELVATDGTELEPVKVDALILHPGERIDVRIQTLRHPRRPLYRMVIGLAEQLLANTSQKAIYGLAELEYGERMALADEMHAVDFRMRECFTRQCTLFGCPFQMETPHSRFFTAWNGRNFSCEYVDHLKHLNNGIEKEQDANNEQDVEKHVMAIDPRGRTVDGYRFQMPNTSLGPFFMAPQNVIQAHDCSKCAQKPCDCFYHKRFTFGYLVQITFINRNHEMDDEEGNGFNGNTSPLTKLIRNSFSIHLHGISFEVLKIGYPTIDADGNVTQNRVLEECLHSAECLEFGLNLTLSGQHVRKDTVLVPAGGFTVIRFRADSRGWRLAETQQNGRGSVAFAFAIGNDEEMPKPPEGFPSDCGTFEPGTNIYEQFKQ